MSRRRRRWALIKLSPPKRDGGPDPVPGRSAPRTALLMLLTVAACVVLAIAVFGR